MDLSELGGHPISAEHPAGEDVRASAEFEALTAEIDRVNDTANPGQTDWTKVIKLATVILSTQGKDLLVASYLAVGLMRQKPVEGFAQGLRVLRDMIVQHWDGLFPPAKRMRGRRNALQYWLDATEELMRDANPAPLEQELVDAMQACIDDIDALLREKDDEPPGVFRLASIVKGFPVRVEAPVAAPAPESDTAGEASGMMTGATALEVGPVASGEDADRAIESGFTVLRSAADYLLEYDPANPLGYRIGRWIAWSRITGIEGDESGVTIFPAPDSNYVDMLVSVEGAGDPLSALRFAETQFPENPLWLDLNRCAARALHALGEDHAAAAHAILLETALVAARLGGGTLRFSDGTPFASPETRQWLSEAGSGSPGDNAAQPALSQDLGDAMKKAAALAGNGDLLGAASALQRGIGKAANANERFQARVKLGEFVLNGQVVANPWPFVQPLLEDIDRHRIDEWDPALAVAGLRVVFGALGAAGDAAPVTPTTSDLLTRIALLDYAEALRLSGMQ